MGRAPLPPAFWFSGGYSVDDIPPGSELDSTLSDYAESRLRVKAVLDGRKNSCQRADGPFSILLIVRPATRGVVDGAGDETRIVGG